jgi:cytidylate kinase
VNGEDVTAAIRTPEVDAAVSRVSAVPAVRAELVERQRAVAAGTDVVAEGRDIGTVVFPDAEVKVFMTASPRARAARRCAQMGEGADEAAVLAAIVERDRADSSRAVSPLTCAPDAVRIDSSELTVDEVVHAVRDLVAEARRNQR